jgi:broad specificity phosphatase PhoE
MLFLVRHGNAGSKSACQAPDRLRPLSLRGRQEAGGLAEQLREVHVSLVMASPAERCVQTVAALARVHCLPVQVDDRLRPHAPIEPLLALATGEHAVLCTHGDVIRRALDHLRGLGAVLPPGAECRKGSTWMIGFPGDEPPRAVYLPPLRALRIAG